MATQGILSLVSESGDTIIKAVCGASGMNVPEAAKALKAALPNIGIREMFDICVTAGMETLVVMDNNGNILSDTEVGDVGPLGNLWYDQFHDPKFNPRWENGTAAYVELVSI